MATNTERLFAFCNCAGLTKHDHGSSLLLKKNECKFKYLLTSHPTLSQLLSNSSLFSLSFTKIYTHEQFHTLTVYFRQCGYSSL